MIDKEKSELLKKIKDVFNEKNKKLIAASTILFISNLTKGFTTIDPLLELLKSSETDNHSDD